MNKINSEFNACMHKDTCIKLQSRIAQLESEKQHCGNFLGQGKGLCDKCANGDYQSCRYTAQAQQSQWISVEERLPPRSTEVLVYPMLSAYSHIAWHDGDCWRVTEYEKYIGEVHTALSDGLITHWMPLPKRPNED